jgi:hypothetical protein
VTGASLWWAPAWGELVRGGPLLAALKAAPSPPLRRLLACWAAMSAGAELAAVSSSLDELTKRLARILADLSPADEERYGADLREVERSLGAASRRLQRLVSPRR